MKIISIDDFVTDFYYENQRLIGVDGGITAHNIIANLSKLKYKTKALGVRGNDSAGLLAIESLKNFDIDIDDVAIIDSPTRCVHLSFQKNKESYLVIGNKRCPVCGQKKWYEESKINPNFICKKIDKNDILVIGNLNDKNIEIIKKSKNKIMLDLGEFLELEPLSDDSILEKFKNKFIIVQLNNRVSLYLCERFNIFEKDLISFINAELIVITKGKCGSTFYYKNKKIDMKPEKRLIEIDSTGAGDTHFALVIDVYIKNNFLINEGMIKKSYETINKIMPKVITSFGARGHLNELYKIKTNNVNCICENFEIIKKDNVYKDIK